MTGQNEYFGSITLKILVYHSIVHQHREVGPAIDHLAINGMRMTLLLGWRGPSADEAADHYAALGIDVLRVPHELAYDDPNAPSHQAQIAPPEAPDVGSGGPSRWRQGIRRLLGFVIALRSAAKTRRYAEHLLMHTTPDIIIIGTDHSCGRCHNALKRAAQKQGIPCVSIPYSSLLSTAIAERSVFYRLKYGMVAPQLRADHGVTNRIFSHLAPSWTREKGGVRLFRFDPLNTLAARLYGLVDLDPWQNPSHDIDLYLAPTDHAMRLLAESGFPMDKVKLVGMPRLDKVAGKLATVGLRSELLNGLGIPDDASFILWNMEPGWEHGYRSVTEHWSQVKAIAASLRDTRMPVVISLHPLCHHSDYEFIEETPDFVISRNSAIHDLLPFSALVISYLCSTNIIASIFGKKSIIFDPKRYVAEDGESVGDHRVPGSEVVHSLEELANAITNAAAHFHGRDVQPALLSDYRPACHAIQTTIVALMEARRVSTGQFKPTTPDNA